MSEERTHGKLLAYGPRSGQTRAFDFSSSRRFVRPLRGPYRLRLTVGSCLTHGYCWGYRYAVNSRHLLQRFEFNARNQQCADQFPVVVAVVKEEEESRLWNVGKIGMWHAQLAPVSEIDSERTKRDFTKKSADLFKHVRRIPRPIKIRNLVKGGIVQTMQLPVDGRSEKMRGQSRSDEMCIAGGVSPRLTVNGYSRVAGDTTNTTLDCVADYAAGIAPSETVGLRPRLCTFRRYATRSKATRHSHP